jgi:hypothetical protein
MIQSFDFERFWLDKFSACLEEIAGREIRDAVISGSECLSDRSMRSEVIAWSRGAMERLDTLVDEKKSRDIMTGCACRYSTAKLEPIKEEYARTRDVAVALRMLQGQFESFLRVTLELDEEMVKDIIDRGWGSAGVLQDNTVIATKIPKSEHLIEYMSETDPQRRRQLYCHCPRIRDVLKGSDTFSPTYCYCGAGFYKGIWEEILQQPVEVELLESVLQGDDVCKVAVRLP